MLAIVKYIKENGLAKAISEFKLKSRIYDKKVLIKYNQVESNMGLKEVQESRGLILEKDTWNVLSLSFYKFFNNSETYAAKIDWNTAHVLEKLDGSLISLYYDWNKEKWFAATTGTGEGEGEVNNKLGTTFNELFWNTVKDKFNLSVDKLNTDFVYMFELTTPYNIVVKPHAESSATLLAIRDRNTLEEVDYNELTTIADSLDIPIVKRYDLNTRNVGSLLKTFEGMVWYDEGYVVVDGNFNRIKIKNPAYIVVHHLKSKTAEHNIMTVVKSNEIEEFASTFPERREEIFNLKGNYDKLINNLESVWDELKDNKPKNITSKERKRFAMLVKDLATKRDVAMFTGLFFGLVDYKVESVKDYMFNYDDKKLYKML